MRQSSPRDLDRTKMQPLMIGIQLEMLQRWLTDEIEFQMRIDQVYSIYEFICPIRVIPGGVLKTNSVFVILYAQRFRIILRIKVTQNKRQSHKLSRARDNTQILYLYVY